MKKLRDDEITLTNNNNNKKKKGFEIKSSFYPIRTFTRRVRLCRGKYVRVERRTFHVRFIGRGAKKKNKKNK